MPEWLGDASIGVIAVVLFAYTVWKHMGRSTEAMQSMSKSLVSLKEITIADRERAASAMDKMAEALKDLRDVVQEWRRDNDRRA